VFAALRELLRRLAETGPLVLVIDDLQWADADSLAMLYELLRPPASPALLLVATTRTGVSPTALPGDLRRVPVERLSAAQGEDLAAQLFDRAGGDASVAAAIAAEAAGHPLFIDELVRHALGAGGAAPGGLHLEDALRVRIDALDAQARRVLDLSALAGVPVAQDVLAQACDLSPNEFARTTALLRVSHLLRGSGVRGSHRYEPYHDRIRDAALEGLPLSARPASYRRLALALETAGGADAEALATSWHGAGEPGRASGYAAAAATEAAAALAFDRAARLYRLAIEWRPDGPDVRAHAIELGAALANAGRGHEAARVFAEAAEGASAAEALELKRRAAEQLLFSGHLDEGLTAVRGVLGAMGMTLTATPRRALVSLLFRRAQLGLRGLAFQERDASQVSAEVLRRIDVCWSVSIGLGMTDIVGAADFQTRTLLAALAAGEPYRVARSLAMEAIFTSTGGAGARARAARLVEATRLLAERCQVPLTFGWVAGSRGLSHYQVGEWRQSLEALGEANAIMRDHGTGLTWELDTQHFFTLQNLFYLGRFAELAARVPLFIRDAEDRGDRFAGTMLRIGAPNAAWLVVGDLARARAERAAAMPAWSRSGFHLQHLLGLYADAQAALYAGEPEDSWRALGEAWQPLERSLLLRVQVTRVEAVHVRARLALARGRADAKARPAMARAALTDARRLASEGVGYGDSLAALVAAGAAALEGHDERAGFALEHAEAGFEAAHMVMFAAASRRARGRLLGGAAGAALVGAAEAAMRAEGVADPARVSAMLAPGFAP
jgi:hypothetical protein